MKTIMQFRNLTFILSLFVVFSCSNKQGGGQAGMSGQVGEYKVMTVKEDSITLYKDYPTTMQGIQTVEIRPKVPGYIESILIDEGDYVKKGQILFRLNANDLMATVRSAEAQVKVAEANVATAKINLEKTKPLVDKGIISKFNLQSVEASCQANEAQLAQAKANLANAKANLEYTVITSPTTGFIGNFPYRVGSLVSSAITQPLTTIANTSEMYAYFSMNEKEFLALIEGLTGKTLQEKLTHMPKVSLIMANNSKFGHSGKIETASGLVDLETGSVNMRATFPNPEGILRSGGSGSIRIPQHLNSALIIPQSATYDLQEKHFVYVVGEGNKVKNTEIDVIAGNLKNSYVVSNGLKPGDQIVIEGISTLRDGTPVNPKVVEAGTQSQQEAPANQVKN